MGYTRIKIIIFKRKPGRNFIVVPIWNSMKYAIMMLHEKHNIESKCQTFEVKYKLWNILVESNHATWLDCFCAKSITAVVVY